MYEARVISSTEEGPKILIAQTMVLLWIENGSHVLSSHFPWPIQSEAAWNPCQPDILVQII